VRRRSSRFGARTDFTQQDQKAAQNGGSVRSQVGVLATFSDKLAVSRWCHQSSRAGVAAHGPGRGGYGLAGQVVVPARNAVDQRYAELICAGVAGRQPPFDAFWGARCAIEADPDGK
jgi:uncharacterized glyoxalase superfamily protein PhnB